MRSTYGSIGVRANVVATLWVIVGALISVAPGSVSAQGTNSIDVDRQLYVVGRDSAVTFTGQLPTCAGSEVTLAFYQHGPARRDNPVDATLPTATLKVSEAGALQGSLSLSGLVPRLATVWAGVSGDCLDKVAFASTGPVLFGVLDDAADGSGALVIPAAVLNSTANIGGGKTLAESVGSIAVFADGRRCTEVSLTANASLDAEGNARIRVGGQAQPAECSREGATLTFKRADGQALVEKRQFVPGVRQPLANLAPEAPSTGPVDTVVVTDLAALETADPIGPGGRIKPPEEVTFTVTLTWSSPPGFAGTFEVERATRRYGYNELGPFERIRTQDDTGGSETFSESVPMLSRPAQSCYRVRAVTSDATGPYSNVVCTIIPPSSGGAPTPAAPDVGNAGLREPAPRWPLWLFGSALVLLAAISAAAVAVSRRQ